MQAHREEEFKMAGNTQIIGLKTKSSENLLEDLFEQDVTLVSNKRARSATMYDLYDAEELVAGFCERCESNESDEIHEDEDVHSCKGKSCKGCDSGCKTPYFYSVVAPGADFNAALQLKSTGESAAALDSNDYSEVSEVLYCFDCTPIKFCSTACHQKQWMKTAFFSNASSPCLTVLCK